jgi:hypothetical protein
MDTYYVWSGAAGANNGPSWTDAYTAFASAVTAATTDGDIILVQYTHQENLAADTTYTLGADVVIIAVDKDSSDAPTEMGANGWIGHSTSSRGVTLNGAVRAYTFGLTVRQASTSTRSLSFAGTAGAHHTHEKLYAWNANTNTVSAVSFGGTDTPSYIRLIDCTILLGNAAQQVNIRGDVEITGGSLSASGSAPTSGLFRNNAADPGGGTLSVTGMDLSHLGANPIVGDCNVIPFRASFDRCKLGTNFVVLASQTNQGRSGAAAIITDCHSGDTHGIFGYYDSLGSVVSDTGVYFTTGAAAQSWKITTTAQAGASSPFVTPPIAYYNSATSAITPYIEVLRDGSATAYTNAEVWAEFGVKTTSGSTLASFANDWAGVGASGSAQADGAGLGSWTGESGTAKSFKCDSGASVTPAEVGDISGRIYVAVASISGTLYVDPQIRT